MSQLRAGDLVWGKMKGYPAWPGKVVYPPTSIKVKKGHHYVFFFGSENYAWVPDKNIFPYAENIEKFANKNKSASFQKAVEAIANYVSDGETSDSEDETPNENEVISKSDHEMNVRQPVVEYNLQKGKGKKEGGRLNTQEHRVFQSEHSRPSEATVETAKERREKIQKRMLEAKLESHRRRNFESVMDSGQMHRARIQKRCTKANSAEKEQSGKRRKISYRRRTASASASSEDEILFDNNKKLPVPLTHIKVESDNELAPSSSDSDDSPLVVAEKPEVLGCISNKICFKSHIVASRKATHVSEESDLSSQQSTSKSDKSETQMRHRKQKYFSSFHGVLNKEVVKPSTSGIAHIKSLINDDSSLSHLVANKEIRMPIVVVSREDQAICAQQAASFNAHKNETTRSEEIPVKKAMAPTEKKIGFIGLGPIGRGIVTNLLLAEHKVNLWNRHSEKCDAFVSNGATVFDTPSALVEASDIIFLCVSDSKAVNEVMFENMGIVHGLTASSTFNKGLVNMTSMSPEKSVELNELLSLKRIEYLEAQIEGSKAEADEGKLVLICSGSIPLYRDCASCFYAMTGKREPILLTSKVDDAPKMKLVLSLFSGILYAGVGEAIACVEQNGLNVKHFLEILKQSDINCAALQRITRAMIESDFTPDTPLKNIHSCLKMSLVMSHKAMQALPLASIANEIYKVANRHKCADKDVSALIMESRV